MSRRTTRPAHSTPAANSTNHAPDRPDAASHPEAHPETSTPHRTLSEMFFRPFPELPPEWQSPKAQDTLLREYVNHRGNFADFALDRGISIDQLYDWLHSEQVIEKCKRLESMANRQSALLATLIRPDALKALADVIISPDSTPAQRRLAASAVLRACDKLTKSAQNGKTRSRRPASSAEHDPLHALNQRVEDEHVDLLDPVRPRPGHDDLVLAHAPDHPAVLSDQSDGGQAAVAPGLGGLHDVGGVPAGRKDDENIALLSQPLHPA